MNSTPLQSLQLAMRLFLGAPVLFFSGCTSKSTSPHVALQNVTASVGGVPRFAQCAEWEDGCALIVITTVEGKVTRGADWRPTLALWVGEVSPDDGRKVTWECQSSDGSTGKITVNDSNYDLAAGSVILVKFQDESPIIKQLDRNTLSMAPGKKTIETLLLDSEVAQFFSEATK